VPNITTSSRRWEDLASIGLGLVAIGAAWFLHPAADAVAINATIVGIVIVALAALDLRFLPHWEEPFEMACGAWLIASPYWLGYPGLLRTVHLVIGVLVIALAIVELWQDRDAIET
jgi:hypothetical protein